MGSLNMKPLQKGLEALTTRKSSFTLGWHNGLSIPLLICELVQVLVEHEAQKWERLGLFTPEDPDAMSCSLGHFPILLLARQAPAPSSVSPAGQFYGFAFMHMSTSKAKHLFDTSRPNQMCPEKTLKLDFPMKNIQL